MSNYKTQNVVVAGAAVTFRHYKNGTIEIIDAWVECWRSFLYETGNAKANASEVLEWALESDDVAYAVLHEANINSAS